MKKCNLNLLFGLVLSFILFIFLIIDFNRENDIIAKDIELYQENFVPFINKPINSFRRNIRLRINNAHKSITDRYNNMIRNKKLSNV